MKLISFITLALGLFLAPCPSQAQSVAKTPRIGILTLALAPNYALEAFRQGLHDLGYMEGQSIALEYRFAEGGFERLPELAAELLRLKVDVILADGGQATAAARHATETIPIVFPAVPDPVGQGLVASLAQPGGNTTGLSFQDPELMGKRLELLKEAVPGVTRVAYLWHSSRTSAHVLQELEIAARALGVQLQSVEVRDPYPFDQAFATMAEAHTDAVIPHPSGVFGNRLNGPVEGHINRLKLLKRQMFGRAHLDLLGHRFLRVPRKRQAHAVGSREPAPPQAMAA